jgi:DNA-binding response OmpR family regulator
MTAGRPEPKAAQFWAGWTREQRCCMTNVQKVMRILLADDDPVIHGIYGRSLARAGFEVCSAHKGRQALDVAVSENPPVIVLDIDLPDISGMAVLREMRRRSIMHNLPVVVITGAGSYLRSESEARELGAVGFLAKPFSPDELLAEVRRAAAIHEDERVCGWQA